MLTLILIALGSALFASAFVAVVLFVASADGNLDLRASVDVPVPRDEAFRWLADFDHMARWRHTLVGTTESVTTPFTPRSKRGFILAVKGQHVPFEMTVRDVLPGQRIDFHGISQLVDLETSYVLEPIADGSMTRVTVYQRARYKGLLRYLAATQTEAAKMELQSELVELQARIARELHSPVDGNL